MPTNEIKFQNGLNRNKFIRIRVRDADRNRMSKERIKWWINNARELTKPSEGWMRVLFAEGLKPFSGYINLNISNKKLLCKPNRYCIT